MNPKEPKFSRCPATPTASSAADFSQLNQTALEQSTHFKTTTLTTALYKVIKIKQERTQSNEIKEIKQIKSNVSKRAISAKRQLVPESLAAHLAGRRRGSSGHAGPDTHSNNRLSGL